MVAVYHTTYTVHYTDTVCVVQSIGTLHRTYDKSQS